MTPLEIITAARQFHNAIGDDFWSDSELYNHLYFCANRLATEAECIENRYTTVTVASQQEYAKPTRSFRIMRVEYNSQKLDPISFRSLDSINLNSSTTVTGTPQYYYYFDDVVGLYPTPATAGVTVKIYSYDYPNFPSGTSTLEIPVFYHPALVKGVRAMMSPKELGHPNTVFYADEWEKAVREVIRQEKRRRRGDKFNRVLREEDLPNTQLGYI